MPGVVCRVVCPMVYAAVPALQYARWCTQQCLHCSMPDGVHPPWNVAAVAHHGSGSYSSRAGTRNTRPEHAGVMHVRGLPNARCMQAGNSSPAHRALHGYA